LEGVTLYGSRARGDFKDYSDIDLLIVLKDDAGTIKKEISDMTNRFNLDNDVRLQTLCASKREWADPSFRTFLLFEKIRREGIPFYG
jgi:predicted nucleotidyltransferase